MNLPLLACAGNCHSTDSANGFSCFCSGWQRRLERRFSTPVTYSGTALGSPMVIGNHLERRMRLWTLHPKYLDGKGLVALWREALLAQAVLRGETRGYRQHPQLVRFREAAAPLEAVAGYLREVQAEGTRRGYSFDPTKIFYGEFDGQLLETQGQLEYEWARLQEKLRLRAPTWLAQFQEVRAPEPHPLFMIVPGPVAPWESLKI